MGFVGGFLGDIVFLGIKVRRKAVMLFSGVWRDNKCYFIKFYVIREVKVVIFVLR